MGYKALDDRNIRREFFKAFSAAEAGSWADRVGFRVQSDRGTEDYKWLGGAPIVREWVGGRLEVGIRQEEFSIKNLKFEATVPVPLDDLRRDKTGMLAVRVGELAQRAATHWEQLLTDLITTDGICYDGQNFFDTDHVSGDSGALTNELGATEVPASNVSDADVPTATELSNIITQIVQHMYGYKDDRGEPINQNAKAFDIMVPVNMMAALTTALSAQFLSNGVTNVAQASGMTFRGITNPRLSADTVLYMFRSDGLMKPFIMQEETGVQTQVLGAGSDEEFKNDRHLFGIKTNRNAGYGLWQHAAKVTLT